MIRLTCLLRRKEGMSPGRVPGVLGELATVHWWRARNAAATPSATSSTPARSTITASDDDRSGYDGVTVQWFESMDAYFAHMAEDDFPAILEDTGRFLDTDRLEYVLTEEPR